MFRFAYRVLSATIFITILSAAGVDLYFGFAKLIEAGFVISRQKKNCSAIKSGSSIHIAN